MGRLGKEGSILYLSRNFTNDLYFDGLNAEIYEHLISHNNDTDMLSILFYFHISINTIPNNTSSRCGVITPNQGVVKQIQPTSDTVLPLLLLQQAVSEEGLVG